MNRIDLVVPDVTDRRNISEATPSNPLVVHGSNIYKIPAPVPACGLCKYRVKGSEECGHPTLGSWDINWLTGKPKLLVGQGIALARSRDGGCGPEGRLYERQSIQQSPTPYKTLAIGLFAGGILGSVWFSLWCLVLLPICLAVFGQAESKK